MAKIRQGAAKKVASKKRKRWHFASLRHWLILKNKAMYEKADELFRTSGIKISPEGDRHLGAVVGL